MNTTALLPVMELMQEIVRPITESSTWNASQTLVEPSSCAALVVDTRTKKKYVIRVQEICDSKPTKEKKI